MTAREMTSRDELHWLAFCYVSGELSAAETATFEARLAMDESACEAVVLAVQTCRAIAVACDTTQARSASDGQTENLSVDPSLARRACVAMCPVDDGRPSRWSRVAIATLAGTAVTAVCVALSFGLFGPSDEQVVRRDGTERLVAAWAHGEAVRNDLDDDADALDVADDDLDPPDWMLAALSADELTKRMFGEPPDFDDVQEN